MHHALHESNLLVGFDGDEYSRKHAADTLQEPGAFPWCLEDHRKLLVQGKRLGKDSELGELPVAPQLPCLLFFAFGPSVCYMVCCQVGAR